MAAPAKLISTSIGFQDPKGNVVANGMLMLTLSQTATVTASGGQVTTEPIYLMLDAAGKITSTAIWFQDELSPSGTIYYGTFYASNKMRMIPGLDKLQYSITGASFDLATAVQAGGASPSYSGAVLLAPTGNQTIATNDLLPGVTATQNLGSASKLWNAFLSALQAVTGAFSTSLSVGGGTALTTTNATGTGNLVKATAPTISSPSCTGTDSGAETLINKVLNGTGVTNVVTYIDEQGPLTAVVGTGADAVLYTKSIGANIIAASKGIKVTIFTKHTTGTGAVTYKLALGGVTVESFAITSNANVADDTFMFNIWNNSGVQNAQHWSRYGAFIVTASYTFGANHGTMAVNAANALALTYTMNAANTEQVTPAHWIVELIQ